MSEVSLTRINENLLAQLHSQRIDQAQQMQGMTEAVSTKWIQEYQQAVVLQKNQTHDITLSDFNQYYVINAYASMYQKVSQRLKNVISAVDSMREFYLFDVIVNQLTEDALAPQLGNDGVIRFSHKDTKVQDFVNDMKEKIGLDQMLQNIVPDLIAYGDYVLETDVRRGSGLLGLFDNVDQGSTVPLIQDGQVDAYLHTDEMTGIVEKRHVSDFVLFSLGGQRIKVRFDASLPGLVKHNEKVKRFFKRTPKFLRVGKSMLYPVLAKLKELELLEKLVPATKLNKLSQGNMIGVPLPKDFDLERGFNAARQMENNINRKTMVDNNLKEITVEAILSTAGRTKVIPIFGEKGRVEQLNHRDTEPDDMFNNTDVLRDNILDSVGVPSELVYKQKDTGSKNDLLKRHAKYRRKLKRIQAAVITGVREVLAIHLGNSEKYNHIDPKSVEIVLNNNLIDGDNLDRLEHMDITMSFLNNGMEFFDKLMASPVYQKFVKPSKFVEFMEKELAAIGLADALTTTGEMVKDGQITHGQADQIDNKIDKDLNPNEIDLKDDPENPFPELPFDPNKDPDVKDDDQDLEEEPE